MSLRPAGERGVEFLEGCPMECLDRLVDTLHRNGLENCQEMVAVIGWHEPNRENEN